MRVRQSVLDAIAAHARRDAPGECCGLLVGTTTEILEAVPADNVASDPRRRYEVAPLEYLAQIKRCRTRRSHDGHPVLVVGVYHSHPGSAAEPSPTDLEQAFAECLYLIAGPADGGGPADAGLRIRAYQLEGDRLREVPLEPSPDAPG
jgi:proteasome lid subunit RPN8/RPN11